MTRKEQIEKILREAFVGKKLAWRAVTNDGTSCSDCFVVGDAELKFDLSLYPLCNEGRVPGFFHFEINQAIALADKGSLSYVDESEVEWTYALIAGEQQ